MVNSENISQHIETIPLVLKTGKLANRILVKPNPREAVTTAEGLVLPAGAQLVCDTGVVVVCPDGLYINVGDTVDYRMVSRVDGTDAPVYIGDEAYLVLFEHDLWAVNSVPYNRVYVRPISTSMVVDDAGSLVLPKNVKNFVQHGIIQYAAFNNSDFEEGDVVTYRPNEFGTFPQITTDTGEHLTILLTTDVFTVNGNAAPSKMIVKINSLEQAKMRMIGDTQFQMHPKFMYMRHFLQYGKVVSAGTKALELNPGVEVGDYVALHHQVEHQEHRRLIEKYNAQDVKVYEERVLVCAGGHSREMFGVLKFFPDKEGNRNPQGGLSHIIPSKGNIFLKYDLTTVASTTKWDDATDGFLGLDTTGFDKSLAECKNVDDLHALVEQSIERSKDSYLAEGNRMKAILSRLNPEIPSDREEADYIDTAMDALKLSAEKLSRKIKAHHLVICKLNSPEPDMPSSYIITEYQHLYPIKIMGKRFLIANRFFIKGFLSSNTNTHTMKITDFTPFADLCLIEPKGDTQLNGMDFILPKTSTFEAPTLGEIVLVGPGTDSVKMVVEKGSTIVYRKGVGEPISFDGKDYILVRQNDILLKYNEPSPQS